MKHRNKHHPQKVNDISNGRNKDTDIQRMTETIEDVMIYYILLNTGYE